MDYTRDLRDRSPTLPLAVIKSAGSTRTEPWSLPQPSSTALFVADIVPRGVRTVYSIPTPVQLSYNTAQDALCPSQPVMQGSVLGKRSQSSSDSPSCPRDLPTPEVTPTAKRIKTTSTSIELNPDGNKENIPPLPESPSPRRVRRTATENHTSPRNARSKLATRVSLCFQHV